MGAKGIAPKKNCINYKKPKSTDQNIPARQIKTLGALAAEIKWFRVGHTVNN